MSMYPVDRPEWGFKAVTPFDAEHPIGSGTMVHYNPGDEVPASEWGRAEGFMIEAGRIIRYVKNVATVPGQITTPAAPISTVAPPEQGSRPLSEENQPLPEAEPDGEDADEEPDQVDEDWELPEDASFPFHKGGPLWVLSDRSLFRGKKAQAVAAEAVLAVAAEG